MFDMKWKKVYGPSFPEYGWVPAPSYLFRRWALFRLLKPLPKGKVLEIGCASGAMLVDLTGIGFKAVGVEISEKAYNLSSRILSEYEDVPVYRSIPGDSKEKFDYVMALEVIEHIDDDFSALLQWKGLLKKEGKLFISVPAHKSKWSSSDEWVGHYRRYEKDDLVILLQKAGFEPERILCYGVPFKNIIDIVRGFYHRRLIKRRKSSQDDINKKTATAESGINRSQIGRAHV